MFEGMHFDENDISIPCINQKGDVERLERLRLESSLRPDSVKKCGGVQYESWQEFMLIFVVLRVRIQRAMMEQKASGVSFWQSSQ